MNYSLSTNRVASFAFVALLVILAVFFATGKAEASVSRSAVLPPNISGLPYFKTLTLTASPRTITAGSFSEIEWNAPEAVSCNIFGVLWAENTGTVTVSPTQTRTYTIYCTGGDLGSRRVTESITITVTAAAAKKQVTPSVVAKPLVKSQVRK